MNYGYNPINGADMVYDKSLGYVTRERAQGRVVRQDSNRLFLTLLSYYVASVIGNLIIIFFLRSFGTASLTGEFMYIFSAFMSTISLAIPFVIYLFARKTPIEDVLEFTKVGFVNGVLLIFAGLGFTLASNFPSGILSRFIENSGLNPGTRSSVSMENPFVIVLAYIAVALIPAVFEEFVFRGVILKTLSKHGKGLAIIVSSVLFGFLHLNVPSIVFATICGLVFGFIYVKTQNIWMCVAIHFLNNAIAVTQQVVLEKMPGDMGTLISAILLFLPVVVGAVCFIILCLRRGLKLKSSKYKLSCGKTFMYILTSPGMLIFLCVSLTIITAELFGVVLS